MMVHDVIVRRVIDGDTFDGLVTVEVEDFDIMLSKVVRFRLLGFNAPELHGDEKELGERSKDWIKREIEGKEVQIETSGKDKYGRTLATVVFEGHDIAVQMLGLGLVERYKGHVGDFGKT